LSLAVGLSLAQSLHPDVRLKWPNDLWWQDRKLGGVLIETCSVGDVRYAVIGVGINIAARDPAGLTVPPAALAELLPGVDAPAALHRLALPLVRAVLRFALEGFEPLRQTFHGRDVLLGREVICSDGLTGTARGVDAAGALLVHTENGVKKISSAEVSVRLEGANLARTT
jgi:BirA family biotin operon repressor/biotin-[acetyl-CoA-carboxylase] ligase